MAFKAESFGKERKKPSCSNIIRGELMQRGIYQTPETNEIKYNQVIGDE